MEIPAKTITTLYLRSTGFHVESNKNLTIQTLGKRLWMKYSNSNNKNFTKPSTMHKLLHIFINTLLVMYETSKQAKQNNFPANSIQTRG